MMKETILEAVRTMVGPKEPIPKAFVEMYERVQRIYSRVSGGRPLSMDVIALMLELTNVDGFRQEEEPVPAETEQPDEAGYKRGMRVSVFLGDRISQGRVMKKGTGPDAGKYQVKFDDGEVVMVEQDKMRREE
ncbi:MAG TPA: hypothetical protein PK054_12630 [Anaerohalosphaeraceae bacterium]|nr:hypothetical protein [Anaerohalosphaeraceae bacterium]HOL90006.1 hypothetical protein [Anaerohalosphaeraceae bacterium]HPP57411.1 hypothetical protein [Anaerohalosphaeraceae bacterium]